MDAHRERAEARLLDHCTNLGRWLDEGSERSSASGRLCDTLDKHTIAMLQRGLGAHPYHLRDTLSLAG
jgi:hypothetical protein